MTDTAGSAARFAVVGNPEPYDVDALRLLTMVRMRRHLRAVLRFCFLAVPGWALAVWAAQRGLSTSSSLRRTMDDHLLLGLLVAASAFVFVLAMLIGLKFVPPVGRVAAALVPVVISGEEPIVRSGQDDARGLVPILRRKSLIGFGSALASALLTFVAFGGWYDVGRAWNAAHGHGGTVTIGRDAFVVGEYHGRNDNGYFLSSPYGKLSANAYSSPRPGQRWAVAGDRAYLVGGHGYIDPALFAMFFTGLAVGACCLLVANGREELRRRKAAGEAPLEDSVAALRAGHRVVLYIMFLPDEITLGLPGPGQPPGTGWVPHVPTAPRVRPSSPPGDPSVAPSRGPEDHPAARPIAASRRTLFGLPTGVVGALVAVVGLLVGAFVVESSDDHSGIPAGASPPPKVPTRELNLSYLSSTGFSPMADASPDGPSARELIARELRLDAAHANQLGSSWTVVAYSGFVDPNSPSLRAAVDVIDVGNMPCDQAVAAMNTWFRASGTITGAVKGLPAGWLGARGLRTPTDPVVAVDGCQSGTLVDFTVEPLTGSPEPSPAAVQLAAAIAKHGITNFRADTLVQTRDHT